MAINDSLITETFIHENYLSISSNKISHWSQSYIKANSQLAILSKFYNKNDLINNPNQFIRKIDKSNINFFTLSSKFLKIKKELDNLNDCLITNLFRQIGDFIKEIERLNLKLNENNNDFLKQIREANFRESNLIKELSLSKTQLYSLEKTISEQIVNETKLKQEILEYKKQIQFYQEKIKPENQNNILFQNYNKTIQNFPIERNRNKSKDQYVDMKGTMRNMKNGKFLQKYDLDISNDNEDSMNKTAYLLIENENENTNKTILLDNDTSYSELSTKIVSANKKTKQRNNNSKFKKTGNIIHNKSVNNIAVNKQNKKNFQIENNKKSSNNKELLSNEGQYVLNKEDTLKYKNELKCLKSKINNEVENTMDMLKNQEKEIQKLIDLVLE